MAEAIKANPIQFDRGIVQITKTGIKPESTLPALAPATPTEARIEAQLEKLLRNPSIESKLLDMLLPTTKNLENLSPVLYRKNLRRATELLRERIGKAKQKQIEDTQRKGSKKRRSSDESIEETLQFVLEDLQEIDDLQDLVFLLKQVVHLA